MNGCDLCKTQKIWNKVVEKDPIMIKFVPNHFNTQKICERTVRRFFNAF